MKSILHRLEGQQGSRSLSTCQASTSDLRRLAVRPATLGRYTFQTMMPAIHPLEHRSSTLGSPTFQTMMPAIHPLEHRSSTLGSPTFQWMMGRHRSMSGDSSRLGMSRVEPLNIDPPSFADRSARRAGGHLPLAKCGSKSCMPGSKPRDPGLQTIKFESPGEPRSGPVRCSAGCHAPRTARTRRALASPRRPDAAQRRPRRGRGPGRARGSARTSRAGAPSTRRETREGAPPRRGRRRRSA
jgi:hypothetical protein